MKNFTWGHGIVLALASFIIFILSMLFLFPNGQKNSELVTEYYYEEELQYQNVIDAKKRADNLAEKPVYTQSADGITLKFSQDINNTNSTFSFVLNRSDDQNLDIKKVIKLDGNQSFTIPKALLKAGGYTLRLSWRKNKIDYRLDYDVIWK